MTASLTARFAERYCEIGLALTWTPAGEKGPRHAGWNNVANAITRPAGARRHWSENPAHGIAALLAPSRLVSVDVDHEDRARIVLKQFGIDVDELRRTAPCIVGKNYRLMYRAPDVDLTHRTLFWPAENQKCRSLRNSGLAHLLPKPESHNAFAVILELRAGMVSDTLPPTIHPGTRRPYVWENPPRDGFPPLPGRLLELWENWTQTSRAALGLCPWAPPPSEPPPRKRRPIARQGSIIEAFNAAHNVTSILEAHGYQRRGKRFVSPDCGHAAGVVVLPSGKVFCHHAGDVLGDGRARDAFDLYAHFEHRDDLRLAVREAARLLGLQEHQA